MGLAERTAFLFALLLVVFAETPIVGQTDAGGNLEKIATLGEYKERTASISFGDVDGDGDQDLVVANGRHWAGQNRLFINDGSGKFSVERKLFDAKDNTYATPLADVDQDGDLDIVVGNDRMPSYVLLNDGKGNFKRSQQIGESTSTRSITLADIDKKDGVDILVTNRGRPNWIFFNDGKGNFERSKSFGSKKDSTIDVAVGDFNSDGHNDLALANRDGQQNYVYFGDGTGEFRKSVKYGTGKDETRGIAVVDFDGDGQLDIVNANIGEPNAIYFGDGLGGFDRSVQFGKKEKSYSVLVVPFKFRGASRIILTANVGSQNVVYWQKPDGSFEQLRFGLKPSLLGLRQAATYGIAAADTDGDGIVEVATANSDQQNMLFRFTTKPEEAPKSGR